MNGGFTGFNPELVQKQLQEFHDYGLNVLWELHHVSSEFIENLSSCWCSPKAVEFEKTCVVKLYIAIENLFNAYCNVHASAIKAYNMNASANGLNMIPDDTAFPRNYVTTMTIASKMHECSTNGVVGMNKANVKIALENYRSGMVKASTMVANTPYDIAFFDENGKQRESYRGEIRRMRQKFSDANIDLIKYVYDALETEINTMELAKQGATNALNGNA